MKERRSSPPPALVPIPPGAPRPSVSGAGVTNLLLREPRKGFYTMVALHEFIQYEIDGGSQTERNERFVTPLCAVAMSLDTLASLPDDGARGRLVELGGEAIKRLTRKSDRLALHGNTFVALLRRTLAKRAREFYASHVIGAIVEITKEAGCFTTASFGISSLTEHLVRSPEDMIQKAFVALDLAKRAGPGSVRVYDLREMAREADGAGGP